MQRGREKSSLEKRKSSEEAEKIALNRIVKGKSIEKSLDRIVGTSDRLFAEKARELKIKAVTRSKG